MTRLPSNTYARPATFSVAGGIRIRAAWGVCLAAIALAQSGVVAQGTATEAAKTSRSAEAGEKWVEMLDPEQFEKQWERTNYGGEGEVSLEDGALHLGVGDPLTGVTWKNDFPQSNYEVKWAAKRVSGTDFFSCITFPVGKEHCSAVVGGWGGGVTGLSSIDGYDASENETTGYLDLEDDKFYELQLRVTDSRIEFFVDGKTMVDLEREGHRFSLRIEVERNKPFGVCSFQTEAVIKDLRYRRISGSEVKSSEEGAALLHDGKMKFVRLLKDEKEKPIALQTAVASYRIEGGKFDGAQVDLVGAVHVGSPEYYRQLNERFESYDRVLFELVADPSIRLPDRKDQEGVINPISSLQVALKDTLQLAFQLDEVDYRAKNFVHADMTPAEFMADMKKRNEDFVSLFARVLGSAMAADAARGSQDAKLMAALASPNRTIALRLVLAEQLARGGAEVVGLQDDEGQSTLVTERNNKALAVLKRELEGGADRLAIFYGAAHLDDMHEKLLQSWGAKLTKVEWLDAWELR